jgi:hypothetical protein
MNFEWLLNPATPYCALALGIAGYLLLFICTKKEMQSLRRQAAESSNSANASFTSLSAELHGVKESVRELETSPATVTIAEGLNLTKRAQALRMHHRGEPVPTIAAALRAPQNEVELLLKIQRLVSAQNP